MKVNRNGLAREFGVSLVSVDNWVRNGCPFIQAGGRGIEWIFETDDVEGWRDGVSAEEPISRQQAVKNLAVLTAKAELMYFYLWLYPKKNMEDALDIIAAWQKKKPLELKQIINSL